MGRAFLLSMDAIVAIGLLFLLASFIIALSTTHYSPELEYQRFYYSGKDVMNVLERAKVSAVMDVMPGNFRQDCNISDDDMEKSILDALGYMWAQNSTQLNECAENLTRGILNRTLPIGFGYEVLIDGVSIYKQGEVNGYLSRLHTIVSGYELGKPVSGYFASAYISRMARSTSSYIYFGGYEGDGNITKEFTLPEDANVTEAYMEANIGYNFTLTVNGNDLGEFYSRHANFTANNWTLCSGYASCGSIFNKGDNLMTLNFSEFINPFIGGGFIRVTYNTSKPDTRGIFSVSNKTNEDNYCFPGITGIINLYSGLRVPGTLNNLTLHVKYRNNITVNDTGVPVYLIIGDTEIFKKNDSGIVEVDMTDGQLRSLLNYTLLSDATTPVRFGMETFHVLAGVGSSDVVLITDRSGSMGNIYSCDVWSNESYECLEGTCPEINESDPDRCSVSCDFGNSICENVCGGTWICPSGTCLCQGETANCCDNKTICNQCGGIYGTRHRINVAKEADLDFIDTILGFEGSRAGLSAYGNDVCSYDDVTYNQTLLKSSVNGYDADCGGTCICCGINKAVDLIVESRGINVLENSGFTGPSKEHWDETGVVNLSHQGAGVDTLEFEGPDNIAEPDIIHVSGNVYAVAYEHTPDSHGYLKTFTIDSSGNIGAVLDSFVFDGTQGEYPDIIHVSGDIYAIAYRGPNEDGWVMTVDIKSSGDIGSQQSNHEFVNSADLIDLRMVHVAGDVYAVAYSDEDGWWDDGYITTFDIDSSGSIGANIDTLEFDNGDCKELDFVNATGDMVVVVYRGPGSDGWLATVDINGAGNIGSVQDTYEFEGSNTYEPSIVHVSGDVYAVAYRLGSDNTGWVKTLEIQSGGAIKQTYIDEFEFDTSGCYMPSMISMYGDHYAIAYRGSDSDGWVRVLDISDRGKIADEVVDVIEFQTSDIMTPRIINASGDIYAIAYRYDPDDDGYVTTVSAGNRTLGLYDYWYVSSDHATYGSLYQNFTIPTGEVISGFLTLEHSTLDSYFDGTADVYCNLTYPEPAGNGYDSTEVTVWSESWNSGNNPVGPVKEEINITDYLATRAFNYTVRCGAAVTAGTGTTIVAFDNIIVNISNDRYNAILIMSDGEATRYCSSFDDYTGEGSTTVDQIDEDWSINASCNARDQGIEVYSVAFGKDADFLAMQKMACWNCSANDWYPGEKEENCTRYFQSNNAEELEEMYKNIAQQMGQASYEAQAINVTGAVSLENALYPESYLRYNYTPHAMLKYGEASITLESDRFGGDVESPKYGSFYIPSGSRVLDAHVTSYSSMYWTSSVELNTSKTGGSWTNIYNISQYGDEYTETGDPFIVNLPSNLLSVAEDNHVSIDTALAGDSPTGGSPYDRAIYHVAVESLVGYGDAYATLENATADAIERLEDKLSDFDITALEIVTPHQYISELPSLWGPSVMEIRVWS
jgi:hypothetical protein